MSNYLQTKNELITYLYARTPLILLKSNERERVESLLCDIASDIKKEILAYSSSRGIYKFPQMKIIENCDNPALYIKDYFKKKRGAIFALLDVNHLNDDNLFSRDVLDSVYEAVDNENSLLIASRENVWSRLSNLGLISDLSFPDEGERYEQVKEFVNRYKKVKKIDYNDNDMHLAASVLRGFSQRQINNILSASLISYDGLFSENIFSLGSQKKKLFESISNVTLIDLPNKIEVAGLDRMKQVLEEKKKIFFSTEEELSKYGLDYPKGILLTGIPGCGKSLTAKYIAQEFSLPLYRFNIDTIFDKYVGESERKMDEALQFISTMAPCIIWIDEIEKALSTVNNSNDTGRRIIGQFLFWLQESRERNLLIATANDVTMLPSELFRKGRFSEIFFIDLPNETERKACIENYIHQCFQIKLDENSEKNLVALSNGFSYADIEQAIKSVSEKMLIHNEKTLSYDKLKEAFEKTISYSQTNPEMVRKYRDWGYQRATVASL
ncbi:MAG: AAA family ATPase [Bacilli bacterium]|nr:AAA family ATPase [Bacilli bacterium]